MSSKKITPIGDGEEQQQQQQQQPTRGAQKVKAARVMKKGSSEENLGEPSKSKRKPKTSWGGPYGKGDPDNYDNTIVIDTAQIVEFHARVRGSQGGIAFTRDLFSRLLKREQTMCLQQMMYFDQELGRLLAADDRDRNHDAISWWGWRRGGGGRRRRTGGGRQERRARDQGRRRRDQEPRHGRPRR